MHDTVHWRTAQHITLQHSLPNYSTTQHNKTKHSTTQHTRAQHSIMIVNLQWGVWHPFRRDRSSPGGVTGHGQKHFRRDIVGGKELLVQDAAHCAVTVRQGCCEVTAVQQGCCAEDAVQQGNVRVEYREAAVFPQAPPGSTRLPPGCTRLLPAILFFPPLPTPVPHYGRKPALPRTVQCSAVQWYTGDRALPRTV